MNEHNLSFIHLRVKRFQSFGKPSPLVDLLAHPASRGPPPRAASSLEGPFKVGRSDPRGNLGSVVRGLIPEVGRHLLEESLDEVCRKGLERLSDAWKVLFGYVCVHVDHEFAHSQDFAGLFFVKPRVVHPAFECCEEEM